MVQYKNHRFHCKGISFQFPENYYYDSIQPINDEDYFYLHAPDGSFDVDIHIRDEVGSCRDRLQKVLVDMEPIIDQPITPLDVGGLSGCYAAYHGQYHQYYEIWLANESGTLHILIYCQSKK